MSTNDRTFAVHEVYPYLRVRGAAQALDFYKRAFGAEELFRLTEPSGRIGHAEIKLGGVTLMLSDEYPEMNIVGPQALGGTSFSIHLHVDNADAWMEHKPPHVGWQFELTMARCEAEVRWCHDVAARIEAGEGEHFGERPEGQNADEWRRAIRAEYGEPVDDEDE